MDLIYADSNFRDIGVIQDYTLDLAYGLDENNFEIKKALQTPECEAGYYVYIEGTEYGGIVDSIGVDTKENILIYRGRTWHGLLATKVIEPDPGYGYYSPQGEANAVVKEIIERCHLDDIFSVSTVDSGINIDQIDESNRGFRYDDVNTGLFAMLYYNDAKLIMECKNGGVQLHVERLMNYATEELSATQINFSLVQTFAHCNHLICLGQGELEKRAVIHLFTDEGGGLLPYVKDGIDIPLKDDDYILDYRELVPELDPDDPRPATGKYEYAEVYDYKDAEIAENYELLEDKPADWDEHYDRYFEISEDEAGETPEGEEAIYTEIERNIQDVYTRLTAEPDDWQENAESYFTHSLDPETDEDIYDEVEVQSTDHFVQVHPTPRNWKKVYKKYYYKDGNTYKKLEKIPKYTRLSKKPKDWNKKYSNYYIYENGSYSPVSGASRTKYKLTTMKPSEWDRGSWKNYYIKDNMHGVTYIRLDSEGTHLSRRTTAPKWQKNTYYYQVFYTITPTWHSNVIYYSKKMIVPPYATYSDNVWKNEPIRVVPTWAANTYWKVDRDVDVGVQFDINCYYRQVLDRYAALVEGGIDRLAELNDTDKLVVGEQRKDTGISGDQEVEERDIEYNIGDIIGGVEEVTGVQTQQPVTKKIVNIENDVVTIQHEVK